MTQLRTFIVAAFMGEGNAKQETKRLRARTAHAAAVMFVHSFNSDIYSPLRVEQPERINGTLHSVWSAAWSGSGQRLWVRECISS